MRRPQLARSTCKKSLAPPLQQNKTSATNHRGVRAHSGAQMSVGGPMPDADGGGDGPTIDEVD